MSWTTVSTTVLPLVGVTLGAAGTLLGQRFATQADARRDALQRAVAQRAERKEAIIGFLSAAERIETVRASAAYDHDRVADVDIGDLTHALWLAKKLIEIVCSAELAQAAHDYTRELDQCTWRLKRNGWKGVSPALTEREHELRVQFMEAARRELGYAGEPLRGRTRSNTPDPSEPAAQEAPARSEQVELPQPPDLHLNDRNRARSPDTKELPLCAGCTIRITARPRAQIRRIGVEVVDWAGYR